MTPKQTALRNVAAIVAGAFFGTVMVINLLNYITVAQAAIGICFFMLAWAVKMLYNIELEKAESLAKLNDSRNP